MVKDCAQGSDIGGMVLASGTVATYVDRVVERLAAAREKVEEPTLETSRRVGDLVPAWLTEMEVGAVSAHDIGRAIEEVVERDGRVAGRRVREILLAAVTSAERELVRGVR